MNPSKILLGAIFLALFSNSNAQVKTISVASPTAASIMKFVDVPVNYHTGTPEITIPIHTVKDGSLEMPINLSYHAGGLKVMEQAGWVGAGWTLQAGGVITRSVRGFYDENMGNGSSFYLKDKGYYSYLYGAPTTLLYTEFATGRADGEPDLFFFNFNGYSGKFYFRPDRSIMLVPQQDIKIEAKFCNPTLTCAIREKLYGFEITVANGDQYFFGKTTDINSDTDPIEFTETWTHSGTSSFVKGISSWYLYKIKSADQKAQIDLTYANEDYAFYNIATSTESPRNNNPNTSGTELAKQLVNGVRLSEIRYYNSSRSVTFHKDASPREDLSRFMSIGNQLTDYDNTDTTGAYALKKISINEGSLCKSFEFSYSYFFDNTNRILARFGGPTTSNFETAYGIHTDKKRLKLDAVRELSCDASVSLPPHTFSYYDEGSVPRTLSMAQDHWGFYNGANANENLVPAISTNGDNIPTGGNGVNRDASWPAMRAGTLRDIRYPTGGRTEFIYNCHNFDGWVFVNTGYSERIQTKEATPWNKISTSYFFIATRGNKYKIEITMPNGYTEGVAVIESTTLTPVKREYLLGAGVHNFDLPPGGYTFKVECSSDLEDGQGLMFRAKLTISEPTGYNTTANVNVGGLRIETINTYDGTSSVPLTTKYAYEDLEGAKQGVLYSVPAYVAIIRNDRVAESGMSTALVDGHYQVMRNSGYMTPYYIYGPYDYAYSPGSIHPMMTSQGSHFAYNEVRITQADGGYSLYNYSPYATQDQVVCITKVDVTVRDLFRLPPNYPPAPLQHDFNRGVLKRIRLFDSANKLLKETIIDPKFIIDPEGINGLIVKPLGTAYTATEYEINTGRKVSESVTELTYDQVDAARPVQGTVKEQYFGCLNTNNGTTVPPHSLLSQEIVYEVLNWDQSLRQATKGKMLQETRYKYVADIKLLSCYPGNTSFSTLTSTLNTLRTGFRDILNNPDPYKVQLRNTWSYMFDGSRPENEILDMLYNEFVFNQWQLYTRAVNDARLAYVTARTDYFKNSERACEIKDAKYNAASTDLKAILDLKKQFRINPIVETVKLRDNKFMGSSLVTYKMFGSSYYIFPGRFDVINQDPQFSTVFTNYSNTDTGVTSDTDYKTEETYNFKSGYLTEVLGKSGVKTSYQWRNNSREYPEMQALNAGDSQVYFQGFEDGTPGRERDNPRSGEYYQATSSFTIPFTPPADGAAYKMSYWYWLNNTWNFSGELPFSATIVKGTALDDIRVYPQGAQLSTYTFKSGKGVSSMTDPNNITTYFEYDALGRMTLQRNDKKMVLKTFEYHYKNTPDNN